ncbi:MAG: hypothetical protein J6Y67_08575 [Lachnospiraceae bacterium]|nr:hypothetical protein [Lachnospiraceae bacterium]
MKLFRKKEKIILRSEQQKEEFVEKCEKAHIDYDVRADRDDAPGEPSIYIVRVYAEDLQKVV